MFSALISDVCALFLLWIFFHAAKHKLSIRNKDYYHDLLVQYFNLEPQITESHIAKSTSRRLHIFTRLLGLTEGILAISIIIPSTRSYAALLMAFMLLTYLVFMAYQLRQGKQKIACGCSGSASQLTISPALLWRNLIFSLMAISCLFSGYNSFSAMTIVAISIALVCISFNAIIEQLIVNQQQLSTLST